MREQKKEPYPAKGTTRLIGNRLHGFSKLGKRANQYNRQRRKLAELERTLVSGYSTYLRVCKALESKFEGFQYENE